MGELIVLTYHKIRNISNFERQIEYLSKNYNVLSIDQFRGRFVDNSGQHEDVLITFDDGDYSILTNGLPVLRKYNCPAILFVITELIDTSFPFWWDEIIDHTTDPEQLRRSKILSNHQRLDLLNVLRSKHGRQSYKQLTIAELMELERSNVHIANHSHTHPMFDQCTEDEIKSELRASREFFKKHGLKGGQTFAYPNGSYTYSTQRILKEEGVEYVFLFDHKLNQYPFDPKRISRVSVNDDTPLWKFKMILSGWHSRIVPLSRRIHKLFHEPEAS